MTIEFKDEAAKILHSLIDTATQAGDFIKEQIPLVIQELIKFNIAKDIVFILINCGVLIGLYYLAKKCLAFIKKNEDYTPLMIPIVLSAVISSLCLMVVTVDFLKLTIAPRVWLLEYAADLIKGGT